MTDEEALEYWEKIRKTFMERYESEDSYWGCHHWMTSVQAVDAAISALRDRIARQNPQPLTDEDLERMGGEPVWFSGGGEGFWFLSKEARDYIDELNAMRSERPAHAYRAKPELPERS